MVENRLHLTPPILGHSVVARSNDNAETINVKVVLPKHPYLAWVEAAQHHQPARLMAGQRDSAIANIVPIGGGSAREVRPDFSSIP